MRLSRNIVLASFLALLLAIPAAWAQSDVPKLHVGVYPTTYTRLIAIADAKGFFKDAGVDVTLRKYPSGTSALNGVIFGEVELGTVVDFRFAWKMLEDPNLRVVASTGDVFESHIVARRDRDIAEPHDLRGKTVGYVPNTISEYALHTFLAEYQIPLSAIDATPVPLLEQSEAVISGEVDAVSTFVTFSFDAIQTLGANGVSWQSSLHTSYNALLVIKKGGVGQPSAVPRFLKALVMAEDYSLSNPEEIKDIVMRDWGISRKVIDDYWDKTRVSVSLNQSIVSSLNLYAAWLLRNNQIGGPPPNVLHFIDTAPLDAVAPEKVTMFR